MECNLIGWINPWLECWYLFILTRNYDSEYLNQLFRNSKLMQNPMQKILRFETTDAYRSRFWAIHCNCQLFPTWCITGAWINAIHLIKMSSHPAIKCFPNCTTHMIFRPMKKETLFAKCWKMIKCFILSSNCFPFNVALAINRLKVEHLLPVRLLNRIFIFQSNKQTQSLLMTSINIAS